MRPTRPTRLAAALAAIAVTFAAPARAAAEVPPAGASAADPRLGIAVEAGAPAGASVALVFRPTRVLRVHAGPAWNYVSWGVLGGVTVVPWRLAIAPSLSAEVGRYFSADVGEFVNVSSGAPAGTEQLLRSVDVTYAAAHLGLELGAPRGLSFSLRAGLAYLRASADGSAGTSGGGSQVTLRDPRVRATAPSVKLGLQYYF